MTYLSILARDRRILIGHMHSQGIMACYDSLNTVPVTCEVPVTPITMHEIAVCHGAVPHTLSNFINWLRCGTGTPQTVSDASSMRRDFESLSGIPYWLLRLMDLARQEIVILCDVRANRKSLILFSCAGLPAPLF